MTGRRRSELVEARADLILSDQARAEAYASHFETQMRHSTIRRPSKIGLRILLWFVQAPGLGWVEPWWNS